MKVEEIAVRSRGWRSLRLPAVVGAAVLSVTLSGCNAADSATAHGAGNHRDGDHGAADPGQPAVKPFHRPLSSVARLSANVAAHSTDVTVDTPVTVRVTDGTLDRVVFKVQQRNTPMPGKFNADHTRWRAKELLEPGTRYVVASRATDGAGRSTAKRIAFRTQDLTLPEQTYARITPVQNEVVGVGMPVIVQFDVPVTNSAAFERRMHVAASPATEGSWNWISDTEVHWRPKTYWKPGTKVHVDLAVNGVDAGNGVYGQMDRSADFRVGDSVVMRANLKTDKMKVLLNGKVARTIPITGGKPGFETRSGTKLIVEKVRHKRMDSATVGITKDDPEYYNIADVEYAQRVTFTGEFLHAAPWSVYAQGKTNVSHGCVGMSPADAAWLYQRTHPGDPVEVTGTHRRLEPGNGWTDWDVAYAQYKQGSAL